MYFPPLRYGLPFIPAPAGRGILAENIKPYCNFRHLFPRRDSSLICEVNYSERNERFILICEANCPLFAHSSERPPRLAVACRREAGSERFL